MRNSFSPEQSSNQVPTMGSQDTPARTYHTGDGLIGRAVLSWPLIEVQCALSRTILKA